MSNQFIYSGDQRIIIQDGAIIWNDQSQEQSSLQYFDANDAEISNCTINESYVTAIDSNETQYLSILEQSDTNDITLEDLQHLTVEHGDSTSIVQSNDESPKMGPESVEENSDENDSAQVIVFTMEGSDDLYGIQLSVDESGGIQKYQFKFRTTSDGQLEPDPETVTLLPNNDQRIHQTADSKLQNENLQAEEIEPSQSQEYLLMPVSLNSENCSEENLEHVYIKGENQESEGETEDVDSEVLQDGINTVPPDIHLESHLKNLHIKTEIVEKAGQSLLSPLTRNLQLKHELSTVNESEFENEEFFDDTLQNESICEGEYVKIQPQEEEYQTEIQVYEQSDEVTDEQMNSADEIHREQFISSEENEPTHEQLVQHFISENDQIEVQYETELEVPDGSKEGHEYNEEYNEQENHSDYSGDYLMEENADHFNPESEDEQYEIENNYAGVAAEVEESTVMTSTSEMKENHHDPCKESNILARPLEISENDKSKKPLVSVKYYVVYPEKENVNSLADNNAAVTQLPVPKVTRSNPRSVLRTSFLRQKDVRSTFGTDELPECDLYHKRFAKNKDAMRAKNFHNFLNRTTIPHAPIRRHRQPRKQEIKPVTERSDEEIIVQEVIVSSTGFIESLNKKVRNKKVQVTAVVELSDSEDDSGQAKKNRRKSHHVLRTQSESEVSVIELSSDNEKTDIPQTSDTSVGTKTGNSLKGNNAHGSLVTVKRRRGRPPKNKRVRSQIHITDTELSSSKRNCVEHKTVVLHCDNTEPVSSTTDTVKKEITCPFCPKSFPSQNSLNTHIIHHNLENSLKNKAKMNSKSSTLPRQSLLPKLEYNHKCDECQETFKNVILLKKHNCTKKQTSLSCSVCLKQFGDITMLNIHKKSHAKSNLVRNTSISKVSPKKAFSRPSLALNKSCISKLKRSPMKSFKCAECPKVCDSEDKLTTHTKVHTKFVCSSCYSTFSSKLLLDTHIRTNCVKMKANNKRLSFTVRKSFIHTPPRRLSGFKSANVTLGNTMNQSVLAVKLDCDKCNMKFPTFRKLYIHKVQKHGLNTPDKTLMTKPKQTIYKPKAAHGGIPANDRLKKAFAELRKKIAETDDLIVQ